MNKASIPTEHRGLVVVEGVEVRFYRVSDARTEMLRAESNKDWVIIPYPHGLPEAAAYLVAARTLQAKQAAIQAAG